MWSQILLIFTAFGASYLLFSRIPSVHRDVKALLISSAIITAAAELLEFFPFTYSNLIQEYLLIILFTLILIVLLMTIRVLKPSYARYPYASVFLPLLVLISYPFIQGTPALTSVILQILQGGSILVLAMLIAAHFGQFKRGWMAIGIFLSMLTAYLIYWLLPLFMDLAVWMWQPFVITGMIFTAISFPRIFGDSRGPDIG